MYNNFTRGLIFGICRLYKNNNSGMQRTMLISKTRRETTASQLQKCVNLLSFLGGWVFVELMLSHSKMQN